MEILIRGKNQWRQASFKVSVNPKISIASECPRFKK